MFYPQIYMDVDCSDITYDTPPSPTILEAVEKAKLRLNATEGSDLYSTLLSPNKIYYLTTYYITDILQPALSRSSCVRMQ